MKNIIKKITVAILSMVVVAGAFAPFSSVFAATFNNDAQDRATLMVSNYTRNPGSAAHWSTSVSANAGEVVSFLAYYHNTAADTANGVSVRVQLPSGAFTSTTVTGDVRSNNASTVSGNASVNLSSSQTLTFIPGSVSWYASQSSATRALLNGQNGSEIVSSNGLAIGDIAGGWAEQGYVVFRAQVSNTNVTPNPQPTGSAPLVSTSAAYSIAQNSAILQSSVNPNNSATNAWFEYGTTQSFGNSTGYQSVGSGTSATNVIANLSNLSTNATYYYRAVAQNAYGTTYGNTLSFSTQATIINGSAPWVTTNTASSIAQTSATLQSSINPNNSGTNTWFEYGTTQSFGNSTGYQSVGSGNGATGATAYLSNLSVNTTYYYRAVAQNSYGTTYGNLMSFTTSSYGLGYNQGTAPSVYTNTASSNGNNAMILSGSVNANSNYTNAWFEYGLSQSLGYSTGYQSVGSGNQSSGITSNVSNLAPNTTYYYRAVAQNSYGTTYGSIVSFTTNGSTINNGSGQAPFVTTRSANSIFRNSALINANVNANGSLATAWFEWGETNAMTGRTMVQPMGQSNSVNTLSAVLSGLRTGTSYYYRAVAQNGYGTTYGNTLTFTTTANQVAPIVINNNTVTEPRVIIQQVSGTPITGPTVILIPSIDNKDPHAGDVIEYSLIYRNETSRAITNSTLKIVLPNEVTYESATLQPSIVNGQELTFDLGTINARSQGTITIKVKVNNSIDADSALVFSATLNYTDYRHLFQATTAYLTVMVGAGVAGLASLSGILGSLFNNWFIDLIIGLLIGFGIYHFFVRQKEEEVLIK